MMTTQVSLSLGDVTVVFTWEEWQLLAPYQKDLIRTAVLESHSSPVALGTQAPGPHPILKLEQSEPSWVGVRAQQCQTNPGLWESDCMQQHPENHREMKTLDGHRPSCAFENSIHSHRSLASLTQRQDKLDPLCKSQESQLDFGIPHGKYAGMNPGVLRACGMSSASARYDIGTKCHGCLKPSQAQSQLGGWQRRRRTSRRRRAKAHVCGNCGQAFSCQAQLAQHRRTERGERPNGCRNCGKTFARRSQLQVHQRAHMGKKPYECWQCGKTFSRICRLHRHQRWHGREKFQDSVCKPQPCRECGSQELGAKPHPCGECGKIFTFNSDFVESQSNHTDETLLPPRPGECGEVFGSESKLLKCQPTASGERPHACNQSGKPFAHLPVLVEHKETHTGCSISPSAPGHVFPSTAYISEVVQEPTPTMPGAVCALGPLFPSTELGGGWRVEITHHPLLSSWAFRNHWELVQGPGLANAVSVVVPSVISCVFCLTDVVWPGSLFPEMETRL